MEAQVTQRSAPPGAQSAPPGAPPKRRLRNYLLDPKFQLKYTGMVVAVTVVVAGILGYVAYGYSTDQSQMLLASTMAQEMSDATTAMMMEKAAAADRDVLFKIVAGIVLLAVALGLTGIVVTHSVVGPSYKLRRLFREIGQGRIKVTDRLRKGDELWDVFFAFEKMIDSIRSQKEGEIAKVEALIASAKEQNVSGEIVGQLSDLRDRMRKTLD